MKFRIIGGMIIILITIVLLVLFGTNTNINKQEFKTQQTNQDFKF